MRVIYQLYVHKIYILWAQSAIINNIWVFKELIMEYHKFIFLKGRTRFQYLIIYLVT